VFDSTSGVVGDKFFGFYPQEEEMKF
jgi:hypothetical protein